MKTEENQLSWVDAFCIKHKIIISDFVSFACSGNVKTPTNTSIVWLVWGLHLPPGSGLQIVKHMIYWPVASWQGPGQVTDSAGQKKSLFFLVTCGTNPTCVSRVVIRTTQTVHKLLQPCNVYITVPCNIDKFVQVQGKSICKHLTAVLHHFSVLKWNTWQQVVVIFGAPGSPHSLLAHPTFGGVSGYIKKKKKEKQQPPCSPHFTFRFLFASCAVKTNLTGTRTRTPNTSLVLMFSLRVVSCGL